MDSTAKPTLTFPGVDTSKALRFAFGRWLDDHTYALSYDVIDPDVVVPAVVPPAESRRLRGGQLVQEIAPPGPDDLLPVPCRSSRRPANLQGTPGSAIASALADLW
jgi:hypothetical protein